MSDSPLRQALRRIDGRPYPAYRDLTGSWELEHGQLTIDRVQGDPYAAPSRIRVWVPSDLGANLAPDDRDATEDWLLRRFSEHLHGTRRGSGRSGQLEVYRPGPEIVARSALRVLPDGIEARLRAGLPAKGRRVLADAAWSMFSTDLPQAMAALHAREGLHDHCLSVRTQRALREALAPSGLVAFIADGSILPRASGVSAEPLANAVAFASPDSLRVTLQTPTGPIRGMGVPAGVTVIVGGGYHGKSTLLHALTTGHVDHVPGDGRERVVAVPTATQVSAEDGRSVRSADISAFLDGLPDGRSTVDFHTDDASGSTSQSAALIEAIEAGSRCLLLDEDRSATNLLVRDERMGLLVPDEHEPITPLVHRVRSLYDDHEVSTVLVCGGVSAFLDVADTVIALHAYLPTDRTQDARALARPVHAPLPPMPRPRDRVALGGLTPDRIRARDARTLQFGKEDLDLGSVHSIRDTAHARTLALAVRFMAEELTNGERTVAQCARALCAILLDEGLDVLSTEPDGALVAVRAVEVVATLSRVRALTTHSVAPV